jgi:hypothetical protein
LHISCGDAASNGPPIIVNRLAMRRMDEALARIVLTTPV